MALFKKKPDPISDRARALSAEIAALEAQIGQLSTQLQDDQTRKISAFRSTAVPHGAAPHRVLPAAASQATPAQPEPIFEEIDHGRLESREENGATAEYYNELGVRKYDLPGLVQRLRGHFRGPSTTNPKLVNYLAAGGIQGLRPMRYEKRVARNRFVALVGLFFLILLGVILAFRHHS